MICPAIFKPHNLIAAQSTRLNNLLQQAGKTAIAEFTDDKDAFDREQTREEFLRQLGLNINQLSYSHQVHGNKVLVADKPQSAAGYDAIITSVKGVYVCVTIADCTPVLIYDTKNKAVAAVHAGWRGTVAKIVLETLNTMQKEYGTRGEDCLAFIGACICNKNFEVGDEVAEQFTADEKQFNSERKKYFVDLKQANKNQLMKFGVKEKNIEISDYCTIANNDMFYSYRYEKGKTGRMLALIGMK